MHDTLSHGQSEPLYLTHLTDDEISAVAGLALRSLKTYRLERGLPYGTRLPADCLAYTGRVMRRTRNFTPVDEIRAWLEAHRPAALAALDKLIEAKAASPSTGE